jgi:hypothetical protein
MKQHKSSNNRNNKGKNNRKNTGREPEENPFFPDEDSYDTYLDDENINPEDDPDFINQIQQFEKNYENSKLIKIYDLIGKPGIKKPEKLSDDEIRNELSKLFELLDKKKVLVHFKNEYPLIKKYCFIINEILNQVVEDVSGTQLHINFIYEDFYPDADMDEGEE